MSADARQAARLALLSLLGIVGTADAQDVEEQPDLDFLEYLGSWEGSDEEWTLFILAVDENDDSETAKRSDPAPEGEESTESENES